MILYGTFHKKAITFFVLTLVFFMTFNSQITEAKKGKFSNGEWSMRYDTTSSPYGCSAAPGGTVTGKHVNFHIYDKKGNELNNLHVWLNYLPTIYVSEGPWCVKMDKTTWKKLFDKIEDYLKGKMSKTTIKSLIASVKGAPFKIFPMVVIVPDCENYSKYDLYSKYVCRGITGEYKYSA